MQQSGRADLDETVFFAAAACAAAGPAMDLSCFKAFALHRRGSGNARFTELLQQLT